MNRIRVFRINGDNLSCWFSGSGALTSAKLFVEDQLYDAINHLPGLTQGNARVYLSSLGYTLTHEPDCIQIGSKLNKALLCTGLFVEAVEHDKGVYSCSVVAREDRYIACPCRMFMVVTDARLQNFRFLAVQSREAVKLFKEHLLKIASDQSII